MKAQTLRTIIISNSDPGLVWDALKLLQTPGQGLTAVQSGVRAEDPIDNLTLVGQQMTFDGFNYTIFLWVTTG